jgi:hypothetical protein
MWGTTTISNVGQLSRPLPVKKHRTSSKPTYVPEMEVVEVAVLLADLANEAVEGSRPILEGAEGLDDPTVSQLDRWSYQLFRRSWQVDDGRSLEDELQLRVTIDNEVTTYTVEGFGPPAFRHGEVVA